MTYYALVNITHNGKVYNRGQEIDLDEKSSASLLEAQAVQTDPVEDEPVQAAVPQEQQEAATGGEPMATGEPSIDGNDSSAARADATDISPKVDETPVRGTRKKAERSQADDISKDL